EIAPEVTTGRETWHRESQRLAAHDSNQPEPPEAEDASQQEGARAVEIEAELAALPDAPDGDVEIAPEVTTGRETWHRESQRLADHDVTKPTSLKVDALPIPAMELRRLADQFEMPLPVVDPALQEDVRRRR